MCGLFGFVADSMEHGVDLERLRRIAVNTERRGPHAFGFAWVERDGILRSYKQQGRISEHLRTLDMLADAVAVVGHCRWVTRGSEHDNANNHPHRCGSGYLVHNGRIPEYDDLLDGDEFNLRSDCDSEILGHLFDRQCRRRWYGERIRSVMDVTSYPIAIMAIWTNPVRVVIARRDELPVPVKRDQKPLCASFGQTGIYVASYATELPQRRGRAQTLKSGSVYQLFCRDQLDVYSLGG